jgi:hypothetical protein
VLKQELSLDVAQSNEILVSQPQILIKKTENIRTCLKYLRKEFGYTNEELKQICFNFPIMLTLNYEDQVSKLYNLLNIYLSISKEELGVLVKNNPLFLSASVN